MGTKATLLRGIGVLAIMAVAFAYSAKDNEAWEDNDLSPAAHKVEKGTFARILDNKAKLARIVHKRKHSKAAKIQLEASRPPQALPAGGRAKLQSLHQDDEFKNSVLDPDDHGRGNDFSMTGLPPPPWSL